MRRIGKEYDFVVKNINKSSLFITHLPFFHFFSCAFSINKLVIFRISPSLFYLINDCIFDSYNFFSKYSRQKGKISPKLNVDDYRQNSKMIKIIYIK